jgi:hypothetical protein
MLKHIPKLLLTIATVLGLYFLATSFSVKSKITTHNEPSCSEKSSECKLQTGFDIRNLSHHLLDF